MATIVRYTRAQEDLVEHAVYLAIEAGQATADRFLESAEASFALLGGQPLIGATVTLANARLQGVRKWAVKGFDNHLIFYIPQRDGVAIIRVLHATSDWWKLL